MPELPEVQSTVDYLSSRLKGRLIKDCSILWARTIFTHNPTNFKKLIVGQRILEVTRRGKFIVISLGSQNASSTILVHLRMSGSVEVLPSSIARDPYDRVVIALDNKKEFRFNDVRKFGKIYLAHNPQSILGRLGIEPLSSEFSVQKLVEIIANKKGAIKPLLLNQTFIAGIGNIYADESLWLAKIHPKRSAASLKQNDFIRLHSAIRKVLQDAIELKGTDNGDDVVAGGMYQPNAYGREDLPCSRCNSKIIRIVVGQRGTHFCKRCQKFPQRIK